MRNLEDLVSRCPDGAFNVLLLGLTSLERDVKYASLDPDIDVGDVIQAPYLLPEGLQVRDVLIAGFLTHTIASGTALSPFLG